MSQYENNMNMLCNIETVFEGGIFFLLGKEMLNKLPSGMMMRNRESGFQLVRVRRL